MTSMTMDRPTTSVIRNQLSEEGFQVASIKSISKKPERYWVMYKVYLSNGETRFVRTLIDDRIPEFRTVASLDSTIDIPRTELLEGSPPLLISEPARGTPLSKILPLFVLPGVWMWKREELGSGVRSLGTNLGRLHTKTITQHAPFAETETDAAKIEEILADLHLLGFDPPTTRTVSGLLTDLLHEEVIFSIAHRDPSPHNVYYRSGHIELIDFNVSIRPALIDVTLGEIGLQLMAKRIPYARRSQERYLLKQFWKGYRSTGIDISRDHDLYISTRVYQLCQILRNYTVRHVSSPTGRLTALTDGRIIRALIRDDCERLTG